MADLTSTAGVVVPAVVTLAQPVVPFLLEKSEGGKDSVSLADVHELLNNGLQQLLALQRDKDHEVWSYVMQKDPSHVYMLWTNRVSNIEKEVASLNAEYDEEVRYKLHRLKRRNLQEKVKRALNEVIKLLGECPEQIVVDKPAERVKEIGVPSIAEYPTLQKAFQDVMSLLQSKGVKCVALYGQKGVGKTTIMRHLNNHFHDVADFDMVVFIKVAAAEQTDLYILQKIADRIKVDREGNEFEVAGKIQKVLENKRYLLILDGARQIVDGIWGKLDISNDKRESKVVISTHYPIALKSKCVDRKVEVKLLTPEEAWKMFRDNVGDNHLADIPTAKLVCERFCSLLPLHIYQIARSFKYQESPIDWQRALNEVTPGPQVVIKLLEKYPTQIVVDKPVERVIKEIGVPSIAEYPTLQKAFQDVMSLLQSKGVKCVALYGQKGVGKTTIMRHLNNRFHDRADFDMVMFIKVAAAEQTDQRTVCFHILQKIADRIKVDREGNEFEVAGRIQKALENKRYLLILNGIRRTVDGIWEKLDISNHKRDSRVVITTHYPLTRVLACVHRDVELNKLSPEEAWKMFRDIVGDNLTYIPNAQLICKRFCCCLPLLIDLIARSFKYQESPIDWQSALNESTPWLQVEVDGLREMYSTFEICYQQLDQSKQKCFLYAALYPANSKIYTDYFVECCIAQGFLGDVDADTKYSEMRRRAKDVVRHLVDVAFLEEGEQMRYFKMNDLYRPFALYISSKDPNSECRIYVDNEEHEEAIRSTSWRDAKWVSMIGSKRDSLPTNQKYGSLQTLLLQKNLKLLEIPITYFDSMGNLLVLNFYGTKIRRLPSLSGLTSLKAFYLNGCSDLIIYSSEIQPLQHLEVFDIRDTSVNFVPCLQRLRCLRISYTASINYHGISELHKLEELTIEVKSLPQWCDDAENIRQEVASLKNLTTFRCSFPSSETSRKFLEISKYQEDPIDWERVFNDWTPSPQVGVGDEAAQLASPREGVSSSKTTNAIGKPHLDQDAQRLTRIQDFLHLMLSYPMIIGYEKVLKQWINDVYQLDFDSLKSRVEHLLSDRPLRHVQALIPEDIIEVLINGGSVSAKTPFEDVPQPMLLLAAHLALHQLTQTLTSDTQLALQKIQNIWFSTRNDAEKQIVVKKLQANYPSGEEFDDLQVIDLNQIDDETERELVLLNPAKWLEQTTNAESPTENDRRSRHLVLVVDGDGDKKLDPNRVSLPIKGDSEDVVVFMTTLSSDDYLTNNVDLTIKTEDHLLPWAIFCKIVGSELLHSSIDIQRIAVKIVEKCGGHLLAIILMAKSLKHVTVVQIWELALQKLLYHNREAIVNAFFYIIYEISKKERVRLIRSLMAFKSQHWMTSDDQLFGCWFSEKLVDTEEEAKCILQNFMECSLLLQVEGPLGQYIQLPEDIKILLHAFGEEIAGKLSEEALESTISNLQVLNLSITHMQNLYDVNTQTRLKALNLEGRMLETLPKAIFKLQKLETLYLAHCSQLLELPPQISELKNLKDLWLTGCEKLETLPQEICGLQNLEVCDFSGTQIIYLPPSLDFPKLIVLLLGNNLNLMEISSSFFDHVPLLHILDLSHTSIHELPRSIFNLKELRKFYLKDCELFVKLPPEISRLRKLITLNLDGTLITHLPKEIQELSNLEKLSLSFYNDSSSAVIPRGVLSNLAHLKYLRISVNSDNEWWSNNVEHILGEINGLTMLQTLDMYIPRVNFLNRTKRRLSNFRFIIGDHKPRMISCVPPTIEVIFKESSPSLKFVNGQVVPNEVKSILSKAWAFFLDRHMKINHLTQFGLENMKQLRLCIVAECNEMQSIVDVDEHGADSHLNESFCMQVLTIFYMKNLQNIVNKPIGNPIFCKLKLLALHTCPELTTIFAMDFLHSLVNLEELIVKDCPKVSSIISCSSSERTTDLFLPRLRKLSLLFVPELASISNGVCIGRNLEEMGLYYCPKLQSLSTAELSSENLKVIRGETEWWENLKWSEAEWGQEDPKTHQFKNIFFSIDKHLNILTQLTTFELMTSFNKKKDSAELEFSSE